MQDQATTPSAERAESDHCAQFQGSQAEQFVGAHCRSTWDVSDEALDAGVDYFAVQGVLARARLEGQD